MPELKIVSMGGYGRVTTNMYAYQYDKEILLVDCGIGFPDMYMPGVDILIPDISWLLKQLDTGSEIIGLLLSHGHDDHIAATPYILPQLPEFPIFASPLTASFAKNRMSESEASDREVTVIEDRKLYKLSENFSFQAFPITHSVPDTRHLAIHTPEGIIYHGSDFKLDPNPVDGPASDLEHIAELGHENVLCMMIDCLRVERDTWTKSESTTGPVIEQAMLTTEGKFILTLMSSHIHRIQQAVDAAVKHGRKVAFIGRSVEQNVEAALSLGKLDIPTGVMIDKRDINNYPDKELCVIIAGSQGQEGSSLVRAIYGEHRSIQIKQNDKVVFSADAIPGNEVPYYQSVDELCRNGVDVIYPEITPNLHQSGHASAPEQLELLQLVKPEYVMPIGGQDRHRVKFVEFVAEPAGYKPDHVLIPDNGEIVAFTNRKPSLREKISIQPTTVDGLGIGDVGPVVISDRQTLGQSGIIVLIIPRRGKSYDVDNIQVVSRGFVFMKEADDVVDFIIETVRDTISEQGKKTSESQMRAVIEKRLARKLDKVIQRSPMILSVFV